MNPVCANCLHTNNHQKKIEVADEKWTTCSRGGCTCETYEPLEPGDVVVSFSGFYIVRKGDRPADGFYEHPFMVHVEQVMQESQSEDETFEKLHLHLNVGEVSVPKSHIVKWEK